MPQIKLVGRGTLAQGGGLGSPQPEEWSPGPPCPAGISPPTLLGLPWSAQALHVSSTLWPEPHPCLGWPPPSLKCQVLEPKPGSPFFLPAQLAATTRPIWLTLSTGPHLTWFLGFWDPGEGGNLPSLTLGNCLWGPGKPPPLQLGVGSGCHFN